MNKKILVLILCIFLISCTSAYTRSSPQFTNSITGSGYYGGDYDKFDKNLCQEGQDFVLQIAPYGCSPTLVTSDLLEEQNVAVYCQLTATKINPVIKVEAIESVSFSGDYPDEVAGVGFHPAQAALGSEDTRLNSPILSNIGYAVVVLKQQENESAMPDVVVGNMTAKIKYDIKNAFGLEKASFYLPVLSNDEWESEKSKYSFWNGQGYLRAESVGDDDAKISVYHYNERVDSISLKLGKNSESVYFPGFDCLAGFNLKLDKIGNPGKTALLDINGEVVEVAEGEKFLDNLCTLKKVLDQGAKQSVEISCRGDDGSDSFKLEILPQIDLTIGKTNYNNLKVGQNILDAGGGNSIYLGYIGSVGSSTKLEDTYAILVKGPTGQHGDALDEETLQGLSDYNDRTGKEINRDSSGAIENILHDTKSNSAWIERVFKNIFTPDNIQFVTSQESNVFDRGITIKGISAPVDENILNEKISDDKTALSELYNNAKNDYRDVIRDYGSLELYNSPDKKLGEEALYNLIKLAGDLNQKAEMLDFCNEFKSNYYSEKPSSYYQNLYGSQGKCNNLFVLSSAGLNNHDILINSQLKKISLLNLHTPSASEYGVEVSVTEGSKTTKTSLRVGDELFVGSGGESIVLKSIDEGSAIFTANINKESQTTGQKLLGTDFSVSEGKFETIAAKYKVSLDKVYFSKMARVSVVPSVDDQYSYANFSFAVGIEKRAIQLSPERVNRSIANLEEQIKDYTELSDKLGTAVETLNAACLTTGTAFTLYNMLDNLGGKSIARKQVMDEIWKQKCTEKLAQKEEGLDSLDECYFKYADEIEADVEKRTKSIQDTNDLFQKLQEDCNAVVDSGIFGKQINTPILKGCLVPKVKIKLGSVNFETGVEGINKDTFISDYVNVDLAIDDLRSLYTYANEDSDSSRAQLKRLASKIISENKKINEIKKEQEEAEANGFSLRVSNSNEKTITETWSGGTIQRGNVKCEGGNCDFSIFDAGVEYPMEYLNLGAKNYLFILEKTSSSNYAIKKVYEVETLVNSVFTIKEGDVSDGQVTNRKFIGSDGKGYNNEYRQSFGESDVKIKYYETGTGSPVPGIVPFSKKQGWYVLTKNIISYNDKSSYDDSGVVRNFYLCNVGENHIEENNGGDDICQSINLAYSGTYNSFPGLTTDELTPILEDAVSAVEQAQKQASQNTITIKAKRLGESWNLKKGTPLVDTPSYQCTDFMSAKQCQILFNVCDPVVCPSSRCNLAGAYPNKNVVQSGIFGSLMLCFPNIKQGIYIPICLTGVKAGLDGWISILEGHRDCLKENLETGKMTGTCDEIYSVYACEFFWKQALPLAKIGIPKLIQAMLGEGATGGGEYLGVQNAFDTAQKSAQYFLGYYQTDSNKFLKADSFEDFIGDEVCKAYVSGIYPETSLFDSLVEPESPPQFHGRFESEVMTTATNPPSSHYKVFYHIFAGKNNGAYYKVYLKSDDGGGYYKDAGGILDVDSGYISTGEKVSETKDFTAPAGYSKMCINVNGQEECGFEGSQVSTSFAVDYMRDQYLVTQANQTEINSEEECLSTSSNIYSALGLNIQSIAENALDQSIYEVGIVRVCSTESPGKGTDSDYLLNTARWRKVGKCSDTMGCWIDMESVEDVIEHRNLTSDLLGEKNEAAQEALSKEGILSNQQYEDLMEKVKKGGSEEVHSNKITLINNAIDKVYWDYQRGNLIFERGNAWGDWAGEEGKVIIERLREAKESGDSSSISGVASKGDIKSVVGSYGGECSEYVDIVNRIASDEDVPANLIMAVIIQESGCDNGKNVIGDGGYSIGLMQINTNPDKTDHCEKYGFKGNIEKCKEELKEPETNIRVGAKILKNNKNNCDGNYPEGRKYSCKDKTYSGWDCALRLYNGWNTDCDKGNKNYVEEVKSKMSYVKLGQGVSDDLAAIAKEISNLEIISAKMDDSGNLIVEHNCDLIKYELCEDDGFFGESCLDSAITDKRGEITKLSYNFYHYHDYYAKLNCLARTEYSKRNPPREGENYNYYSLMSQLTYYPDDGYYYKSVEDINTKETDFLINAKTCEECNNYLFHGEAVECTLVKCEAIGEALGVACDFDTGLITDTCSLDLNAKDSYGCKDLFNYVLGLLDTEVQKNTFKGAYNSDRPYQAIFHYLINEGYFSDKELSELLDLSYSMSKVKINEKMESEDFCVKKEVAEEGEQTSGTDTKTGFSDEIFILDVKDSFGSISFKFEDNIWKHSYIPGFWKTVKEIPQTLGNAEEQKVIISLRNKNHSHGKDILIYAGAKIKD